MAEDKTAEKRSMALDVVIKEFVKTHCKLQVEFATGKQTSSSINSSGQDASEFMRAIMGADVAIPFLRGAPGGGKTASVAAMCVESNWGLVSTHFALKPIEETGGIPDFIDLKLNEVPIKGTQWTLPEIFKVLYEESTKYKVLVWFLDDIHLCTSEHFALMYELFTERTLRSYKLPNNVAICMAGNSGSKTGAKMIFSAIINRIAILDVHTEYSAWRTNFALKNGTHMGVVSFLGNDQYQRFFQEEEQIDTPFGTARSWTRFANFLKNWETENGGRQMPQDLCLYLAQSYVGNDAGEQFNEYYQIFMRFDLRSILTNYKNFQIPDETVESYALLSALVSNFMGSGDEYRKQFNNAFAHILKTYFDANPEYGIMAMKTIIYIEKGLGKKAISSEILTALSNIDKTLVVKHLKEISSL